VSVVTTRICDGCSVDETVRAVHSYSLRLVRTVRKASGQQHAVIAADSTPIDLCNPCFHQRLGLALGSLGVKENGVHRRGRRPVGENDGIKAPTRAGATA
jgi:hypothetical protein